MSERPGPGLGALHLAGLWTLAVAQPHFDFLSTGEAFVLFGWKPLEIAGYAILLVTVPPVLLCSFELVGRALGGEVWRWRLHLFFVGLLVMLLAGYLLRQRGPDTPAPVYLLAPVAGAALAVMYGRIAAARTFASVLALAPPVAVIFFIAGSGVAPLVFPHEAEAVAVPDDAGATPVVLVVFDEFPTASLMRGDGKLDRRRYPGFSELARDATWFPNATSVQDLTQGSLPTILSGDLSDPDKPPSSRAYPETLYEMLRGSHEIKAFEQFRLCDPALCPESAPDSIPKRLGRPLPALAKASVNSFAPPAVVERLPEVRPLDETNRLLGFDRLGTPLAGRGNAPFLFIHSYLPHAPWNLLSTGQAVASTGGCCISDLFPGADEFVPQLGLPVFGPDGFTSDAWLVYGAQQAHLAQVAYADRLLQDLIAELRQEGVYDEAMVVVTADHGVSFAPGGPHRRLTDDNAATILGVPLFIKEPAQEHGRTDRAHVQTIDILPSIAATLGIDLPWEVDGVPVDDAAADREVISATSGFSGETFEFDPRDLDRMRLELARETDRRFGAAPGIQLYEFGSAPELHGRVIPDPASDAPLVEVDNFAAFGDVDPRAPTIPAAISGTVPGSGAGDEVAIGLNGRIVATTSIYDSKGTSRFLARIPPDALRAGRNEVDIATIEADGSLRGLALAGAEQG